MDVDPYSHGPQVDVTQGLAPRGGFGQGEGSEKGFLFGGS